MSEPVETGTPKYYGCYDATVIDNVDPNGDWRVTLKIPGIADKSAWADPFGTIGGGGAQRGGWVVPDIGADVVVMFRNGDLERPLYACGNWANPAKGRELPIPARDVPANEAHQVPSLQLCGGRLSIYVDERAGKRKLVFEDNELGDHIMWDLESGGLEVKMTSIVLIKADGLVRIDGLETTINERLVAVATKAID